MKENRPGSALAGFYVLTPDGELGCIGQEGQFHAHARLNKAFAEYNRQFLRAYHDAPSNPDFRLGVVYQSAVPRKWGTTVFALETALVRRLYGGSTVRPDAPMTAFQQKNREQSLYRGMELFLEYRNENFPGAVIYAPVLLDRATTLDAYPSVLDRPIQTGDEKIRVIEVVNLLAGIPLPRRSGEAAHLLVQTLHKSVVKKDVRKATAFGLISQPDALSPAVTTPSSLPPVTARPALPTKDRFEPHAGRFADAEVLQQFAPFAAADAADLRRLAQANPIERVPAGVCVIARGAVDNYTVFLVEGKLELEASDGVRQMVESGSAKAALPIANLRPRKYNVTTITPARLIRIPDAEMEAIRRSLPRFAKEFD